MAYATTIQLNRFMSMMKQIPDLDNPSRAKEEVGTGDNTTLVFYLDHLRFII